MRAPTPPPDIIMLGIECWLTARPAAEIVARLEAKAAVACGAPQEVR